MEKHGTQIVEIADGRVKKFFDRDLAIEVEKHRNLKTIGELEGFIVPAVESSNPQESSIEYTYIEGLCSSRNLYIEYVTSPKLDDKRGAFLVSTFRRAGILLAAIHKHLKTEKTVEWQPPECFNQVFQSKFRKTAASVFSDTPHAVLHGDFGFSNLCYPEEQPDNFAVIDPSPNRYSSFYTNELASVYLDIAKYTLCLNGLIPLKHFIKIRKKRAKYLRENFIAGYEAEADMTLDRVLLQATEEAIFVAKVSRDYKSPLLRYMASILMYGLLNGLKMGKISNAS